MSSPLRIMRPPKVAGPEAAVAPVPPTPADGIKEYIGRLVKLIPTEVVALYMVGEGILKDNKDKYAWLVWAILCLALVIVVRIFGTSDAKNKVPAEKPLVIISAVSFVIWLYAMGGPLVDLWLGVGNNSYAWMAVLVWTFVIPYIYKQPAQ